MREQSARGRIAASPITLDAPRRQAVREAILEAAAFHGWRIWAFNVRTNHVYIVVTGNATPERLMTVFKLRATRLLRERQLIGSGDGVWTRHGSMPPLWTEESLRRACRYVQYEQGPPLP